MSAYRSTRALLGAAAFAAAALLGAPAHAVNACGDQIHHDECGKGNIYPCCDNGGNCTWWAWESVCRNWHIGLVNWGNANTWATHAHVDPNFDVLGYPVVGSIATRDLGNFGHVAWVVATNGSSVTVTEENCCDGCAGGMRTHTYTAGYFNSGYVVRHGSQCQCSPGQVQSEACGDCGTRSRSCDSSCNWGGWGGCGGPDPGGGNVACGTGEPGVCADGRVRCINGNTACKSLVGPSPEVCDGADNDCDGAVDDGHPPIGDKAPPYAATLVDISYPQVLRSGEHATIWADFRNDGAEAWTHDGIWLVAHGAEDGGASVFFQPEVWPAWDVAAVVAQPVLPGEIGRFAFDIVAPTDVEGEVEETFQLQVSDGRRIGCPNAEITPKIRILPTPGNGGEGGAPDDAATAKLASGCSQSPAGAGSAGFGLAVALFMMARARRASPGPRARG
ncbi:Type IV fimbrial biogenesis protein PilY1 [Minicystis rosea]|nr:Type IV fimbrial biogenesis protein PilY1 [Minicystis rosea]